MVDEKIPSKIYAILKGSTGKLDTLSSDRTYRLRIFKTKLRAEVFLKNAGKNDSIYIYHSNNEYNNLLLKNKKIEQELAIARKELAALKTTVKNLQEYKGKFYQKY